MSFNVSEGAAYAVLYSVLVAFTILAIAAAGWFDRWLPKRVLSCCLLKQPASTDTSGSDSDDDTKKTHASSNAVQYFLAARNSAGMWALALSYFASGMGAWVLYGSTELGATPQLSWLGIIGYSSASAAPAVIIGWWLGPQIRTYTAESNAFSTTDFCRQRYGRLLQIVAAIISLFYMFIYIVAELTAISNVFQLLVNNNEQLYGIGITLSLGLFTILYTTIAGLPASIVTDKFQGVIMAILVIMLTIAVSVEPQNHISPEEFAVASNWTLDGFYAAITLFLAIAAAELFNQSTWQRVWAAESVPSMRKGFLLGSSFVFLLMMFFGVMGMIAYALDPAAYDSDPPTKFRFLAFFDLLAPLANGWHIVTLLLTTALAASSIDSLQNGLTSIFAHDLVTQSYCAYPTWIVRGLMVAINAPAIYLASLKYDVISLFLVADLVCATSVFPVFLGLQFQDRLKGWLPAPTELGAFLGVLSGFGTVLVNGAINGTEGGAFNYFWLQNGAMCALCGVQTMVTFIVTPAVSCLLTYVFSGIDILIRKERARQPLFTFGFDKKDYEDNDVEASKGELAETSVRENSDEADNRDNVDEADDLSDDAEAPAPEGQDGDGEDDTVALGSVYVEGDSLVHSSPDRSLSP